MSAVSLNVVTPGYFPVMDRARQRAPDRGARWSRCAAGGGGQRGVRYRYLRGIEAVGQRIEFRQFGGPTRRRLSAWCARSAMRGSTRLRARKS